VAAARNLGSLSQADRALACEQVDQRGKADVMRCGRACYLRPPFKRTGVYSSAQFLEALPWSLCTLRIVFATQDPSMTIGRNDPCPCGSGKKFKRCCAAQEAVSPVGLGAALRMKGGVAFDSSASAYRAIVHSWDNAECIGEPQQWQSSETFSTEEAAMTYYKVRIRPELTRLMSDAAQKEKGGTFLHRRLE